MSLFKFNNLFGSAPVVSQRNAEMPAIQQAARDCADYLCTATHYADGRRIRERDARRTIKVLDAL